MYVGDAGTSSIAAALGRGAMPRLKGLVLNNARITDAGLAALTPVLQQRHEKLEVLLLTTTRSATRASPSSFAVC